MAKKKESTSESAPKEKTARKASPKTAKASKTAPPSPVAQSAIDTSLAAQTAARMLIASKRMPQSNATAQSGESSGFRQLKESIHKPAAGGIGNLTSHVADQKKSNQPFSGGKQVGHNQTIGGANRRGLPRRTSG